MPSQHTPQYVAQIDSCVADARAGLSAMQQLLEGDHLPYQTCVKDVQWRMGANTVKAHAFGRWKKQIVLTGHMDNVDSAYFEALNSDVKSLALRSNKHRTAAAMRGLFQAVVVSQMLGSLNNRRDATRATTTARAGDAEESCGPCRVAVGGGGDDGGINAARLRPVVVHEDNDEDDESDEDDMFAAAGESAARARNHNGVLISAGALFTSEVYDDLIAQIASLTQAPTLSDTRAAFRNATRPGSAPSDRADCPSSSRRIETCTESISISER